MKISYDPEADALYILFQEGEYEISKEIGDGIIIDYTKDGKVIGIEILEIRKRMPAQSIEQIIVNFPIMRKLEAISRREKW
jgi:uncharacterized protein YuzE